MLEIWNNSDFYENKVCVLPKYLDQKVAKFYLKCLIVELKELNKYQADYIGVKFIGTYKPKYYIC